jgi:hypothetical protein
MLELQTAEARVVLPVLHNRILSGCMKRIYFPLLTLDVPSISMQT